MELRIGLATRMQINRRYASGAAEAQPQTLLLFLAEANVLEILCRSTIVCPVSVSHTS